LICLDTDAFAVRLSRERLSFLGEKVTVIRSSYSDLGFILKDQGLTGVNGILLDLGLSSYQLDQSGRGFSFNRDEPLDMRMDTEKSMTAGQLLMDLSPKALKKILREYGEEKKAGLIVKTIERERKKDRIDSSLKLARLIQGVVHPSRRSKHPATRTFQALRMAVNNELENLRDFLDKVPDLLKEGGRLVILSYHSLEDRMVKQAMAKWEKACICPPDLPACVCGRRPLFRRINRKGIKPGDQEIMRNPRARSAMCRAAERI
jgi:16S rRNA (cytosine1402-N4)-methyltransferase